MQIYTDRHWQRFFEICGDAAMAADARLADIHGRTQHIQELYAFLGQTFETRPTAEWIRLMSAADIPIIEMNTPETLLEDPHMTTLGFFAEEDHPSEGRIRNIGIPQQWSESPPSLRHPAPRLGEHSAALLAEYGFSVAEVRDMLACGAAREPAPDRADSTNGE